MSYEDLYCNRSDVVRRLPPGALMSVAGLVASASADTNVVTYDGHGFETDDPVTVRASGPGGSLPTPLEEGTTYYVRRLSNSTFELAAAPAGVAILFLSDGVSVVVARDPDFDMWIEFYSRWADTSLPAHAVPLGVTEPVHPLVRGIVADMVAERMFNVSGQPTSEAMKSVEVASAAQLSRFAKGLPLRGAPAPTRTNLAIDIAPTPDERGWGLRFP